MDTSTKYVEMCAKATEIHKDIRWPEDVYFDSKVYGHTWLPRQDQLQEMVDWSDYSYVVSTQVSQINDFYNTLEKVPESMEQLWLAFVMKEKFNKEWRDDTWKKAS